MFQKMIQLSEFEVSGLKCEDLKLLRFFLQVLNCKRLKPNDKTWLKCKYQLYITDIQQ